MGASRVFDDGWLAAKAGADVIVVDGAGRWNRGVSRVTPGTRRIPTLAAVCKAGAALEDIGLYGKVQPASSAS